MTTHRGVRWRRSIPSPARRSRSRGAPRLPSAERLRAHPLAARDLQEAFHVIARSIVLAAAIVLPLLVVWLRVVHQDDEILALARNEVVETAGSRRWAGRFVNTNDRSLREVAVTVAFLDNRNATIGTAKASAAELPFGGRLELQAPLPPAAVRLRIQSVEWRMDTSTADRWLRGLTTSARNGPFREPWEFGYVMVGD